MTINTNYNLDPTCFLPPNHEAVYPLDCESRRMNEDQIGAAWTTTRRGSPKWLIRLPPST